MTIDDIEEVIRTQHGAAWWGVFHEAGTGFRFLPTGHVLTARAYEEIRRRFGAPTEPLTEAQRKRNNIRGRSDATARNAAGE
ncbi:MAG: hypothetical protein RLQ73_01690 [Hoeflea sp. D1-CHI-28]